MRQSNVDTHVICGLALIFLAFFLLLLNNS